MSKYALEKLAVAVEELQGQLAALTARLERLEQVGLTGQASVKPAAETVPAVPTQEPNAEIEPEILLVVSAAVAAYLGERAHIRAVRLISTTRWSQEGRVSIQASHQLGRG